MSTVVIDRSVSRLEPSSAAPRAALRTASNWKRLAWPAASILAAVLVIALFQPSKALHSETAVDYERRETVQIVNVNRPSLAITANVVLPATIRPWQTTTLHSRVTGFLTVWHADLGAHVQTGEVLAELETPELDQEVAVGESQAVEAVAATVQAQAELAEAEADLNVAVAQLAHVKAEVELSHSQLIRREKLLRSHAISQEEYDISQKDWEVRTADVTAAESDVARRNSNLKTRAAIIEARKATVRSRQANVERLKELQGFKRIVAPFNGIVIKRTAEVGMLVAAGTEPLFVIEDMSRVRVQVLVPQSHSAQAVTGVEATVSVPESTATLVRGTITRFAASIDSTNRTMLAEIELDNKTQAFQPGSYAQVTLTTPENNTAWTIPANTLQMRVEGPHVAIVGSDNHVEIKQVTLGRNLGDKVMVVDGIRGDERLIVSPSDALVSGVRVQVNEHIVAQR